MGPGWRDRLQALLAWIATPEGSPIEAWRRRVLAAVLAALTVLGSLAYVIGAGAAWWQKEYLVVMVDTVCLALILTITVKRRLPYALRASTLLAVPALLGTYLVFGFGFEGSGFAWLLGFPVLASVLLGLRRGVQALAITAGIFVGLGVLIPLNVMPWTAAMSNAMIMWWVSSSSVLSIAALLALSVGYLSDGLGAEATARHAAEIEADRRQRLAALGTLSGGIAHDFNNLLQPIVSDAEHAQRLLARGEDAQPILKDILQTADRARSLVRRILSFTRPTVGTRAVVDLGELVGESQRLLPALVANNVTFDVVIETPAYLAADPSELQQVLLNLVSNAAQAMPAGGTVRIVVGLYPESEALASTVLEGVVPIVSLAVIDHGVGMNTDTLARIFEPFYTTKGPQQGSGLGLATVHATVMALGGIIQAESTPGRGTRMQVLLPGTDAPDYESASPTEASPRVGPPGVDKQHRRRILVVDDELAVLNGTARLLERFGYVVQRFNDPVAALSELATGRDAPEIVLTDLAMPGLSGWEVAAAVHARYPAVPVVVMTGHLATADDDGAARPGVRAVLAKPFTSRELESMLESAMLTTKQST